MCNNMDGPRDYHTTKSKSESERQIPYDITYMWNLKYDTNERIYKTETNLWLPKGKREGRDKSGAWDEHTHTTVYKIGNQQEPTA